MLSPQRTRTGLPHFFPWEAAWFARVVFTVTATARDAGVLGTLPLASRAYGLGDVPTAISVSSLRNVAIRFLLTAHCGRCGNFDLQRLPKDQVQVWNSWFFKLARVPAYRCAPCRQRFFSILPRRKLQPAPSPAGHGSAPASHD